MRDNGVESRLIPVIYSIFLSTYRLAGLGWEAANMGVPIKTIKII